MAPTTLPTPRRPRRALPHVVAAAALTALALAGCASQTAAPSEETATPEAIATPTQILTPAPREACSAELTSSTGDEQAPDRATVTCGQNTKTVAGDFRHKYTNSYDPDAAGSITQIIAVDDEVRVWLRDGEGTCLVLVTPEDPSAPCKPTGRQGTPAPEPEDGHTVVPEDQRTADA